MGRVNRAKFKQDAQRGQFSNSRTQYLNLKKEKVVKGFIHPIINIYERFAHGMIPTYEQTKKDGENKWVLRKRRWNCLGEMREEVPNDLCPVCLLQEFAKDKIANGADLDEVLLEGGEGSDRLVMTLKSISGEGGFMGNPKARQEVLFVWIPEGAEYKDTPRESVKVATGPQSLGQAIIEVIESEIEERGAIKGDPCVPDDYELKLKKGKLNLINGNEAIDFKPFPFKLKHDKDASFSLMYKAEKLDRDLVEITDDIKQLMLSTAKELEIDLDKTCQPTDPSTMLEGMRSTWISRAIPFEEFEEYFENQTNGKASKKKTESSKQQDKAESACNECGGSIEPQAKFCARCGAKQNQKKEESKKEESKKEESNAPQVTCDDCDQEVTLMLPSFRCPECGYCHKELKQKYEVDIPF